MVRTPSIRTTRSILLGLAVFALLLTPFSATFAADPPATSTPPVSAPATAVYTAINCLTPGGGGLTNPACISSMLSGGAGALKNATGAALDDIGNIIVTAVGVAILGISTLFLGIAGVLFNLVLVKTVFQFSQLIGNSPGLLLAWGILRDLGNMALLFGFIFMGLATILDLHTYNAKKALPPLIIFAVLMNFSLFAAEAIIDTSNAFSSVLYNQASNAPCAFGGTVTATNSAGVSRSNSADANLQISRDNLDTCLKVGIAGNIMQASGLSTIFSTNNPGNVGIAVYVGLSFFAIAGAIVMLAASIMLVIRVLTLTLLMVFAPIGFAGMAVPPLHSLASRWWSTLIHQAFFAPLLLLLIFISLKVTEGLGSVSGSGLAGALTDPNVSTMGIILVFVSVSGFLVGSLKAASSFGAMGASFAISTAKSIVTKPLGGMSGIAGRNTLGKGGAAMQKTYEKFMGKEGGNKFLRSTIRNVGLDNLAVATTSGLQNAKFGSGSSLADKKKATKERDEVFEKAGRKARNQSALDNAIAKPTRTAAEIEARNDAIAEILQRMSVKEIEELDAMKKVGSSLDALAQNLSAEKFAALVKDGGALNDTQKSQAKDARFKNLAAQRDIINSARTTAAEKAAAKKVIRQYSAKDLQNAPPALLADNTILSAFSDAQRDDLIKSNEVNPAITRKLRSLDPAEQIKAKFVTGGGAAVATDVANLKPKKVAKLPDEILEAPEVIAVLDGAMLQAINTEGDLGSTARSNIISGLRGRRDARMIRFLASPAGDLWK